jgi:GNAT superfamily N-acetyltransferase
MRDADSPRGTGPSSRPPGARELADPPAARAARGGGPIRRFVLTPQDVEEGAHVLTSVFIEREPLSLALRIGYEEMKGFSRATCEQAARSGLAVVAKNAAGRIVAFSLSERWPAPRPMGPPLEELFPRMAPIFALLAGCEARFDASHEGDNDALHILVIGALDGYEGLGITKLLVADNMALARERGIVRAYTEATSLSHHLFASLGFETRHEVLYRDFVFNGARPFASITSVPSTRVMERGLLEWAPRRAPGLEHRTG